MPTEFFCYGDWVVNGRQHPARLWCGLGFSLLRLPTCIVYRGRRPRRVALVGPLTCHIPLSTISQPSVLPIKDVNTEVFKETHSPVSAMLSLVTRAGVLSSGLTAFCPWVLMGLKCAGLFCAWLKSGLSNSEYRSVCGCPEYLRHSAGMLCCFSPCPPW